MPPPPPNPYATSAPTSATLVGPAGQFTVRPGTEVRVGRDGAQCPIALAEPRVSAVHATVRLEAGQFWVRDEGSNNGTQINGGRIDPGIWVALPPGGRVRFGPLEFGVRFETT